MNFEIKKLTAADIQLAKDLFIFYQLDDGVEEPLIPSDKYLFNLLSRDTFYVIAALKNGVVAGGLTAYELDMYKEEAPEIFLYEIAVDPLYRRNGIAKELIASLKEICASKGINEMYVGTEKDNSAAIKLYKSTGGKMDEIAWFVYNII